MSFEPNTDPHAIVEVVFGIRLARNFTAREIESLINQHDKFKADLPKINRTQVFQFAFGNGPPPDDVPFRQPAAGVTFDAMKKDGSLDWRLRADDNMLFVNCLSYSRWRDVWEQAKQFLKLAGDIVVSSDNSVSAFVLQYIDLFRWNESIEEYRVNGLLDEQSSHLPRSIFDCGPLWHLHQGWYKNASPDLGGRVLERIHLDAALENNKIPIIKVDTYLQLELKQHLSWTSIFSEQDPKGDFAFGQLHDIDKEMLKSILTESMAKRIGLND